LGPPTFNGTKYDYAVVTDNLKNGLSILVRNVTDFQEKYDADVIFKVIEEGFDNVLNVPKKIYQGKDCVYG